MSNQSTLARLESLYCWWLCHRVLVSHWVVMRRHYKCGGSRVDSSNPAALLWGRQLSSCVAFRVRCPRINVAENPMAFFHNYCERYQRLQSSYLFEKVAAGFSCKSLLEERGSAVDRSRIYYIVGTGVGKTTSCQISCRHSNADTDVRGAGSDSRKHFVG